MSMGSADDQHEKAPLIGRSGELSINMNPVNPVRRRMEILAAARRWWALSRLWFFSEEKVRARTYAGATAFLSILTTVLLLKVSDVQSNFSSAMSEKKTDEFYSAVWSFVGIVCLAAPLFAINDYVDSRIAVEWRNWLARRMMKSYFANQSYFRLKMDSQSIDNPDQRICEDVKAFCGSSVVLAIGVLRQAFYCVAFAGLLYSLAPGLVAFLLIYAVLGTFITAAGFGRRLTALSFLLLRREADLRFEMVRIRESAESVAFYRADDREAATAMARLDAAVSTARSQVLIESWLSLWQNIYSYATILVPSLLMAPKYFAGEVRFGTIGQVSFAFNRIEAALSYVVNNLAALSALTAQTERLEGLLMALDPMEKAVHDATNTGALSNVRHIERPPSAASNSGGSGDADTGLIVDNLTLMTPKGEQVLCRDLKFVVQPGESLLIMGPSGSGKSSLMRAVAGLWSTGSGSITTPHHSESFFLPQKPYMPLGTLRQQLTFPGSIDSSSDQELRSLLDTVSLPKLLSRVGGLDAECDWAATLSLGEQQRVAFLRLLRARPALAFLDEATSGVDTATESKLYAALKDRCQTFISIGHRRELLQHHSHVLECVGEGIWELKPTTQHVVGLSRR